MRELFEKRGGNWRLETKMMLPGYLFAEIPNGADTAAYWHGMRRTDGVLRILGELTTEDRERLKILNNGGIWKISTGVREGKILSGPLAGHEDWIEEIDWHRRRAIIRLKIGETEQRIGLGLIEEGVQDCAWYAGAGGGRRT